MERERGLEMWRDSDDFEGERDSAIKVERERDFGGERESAI